MIYDKLDNLINYIPAVYKQPVQKFLESLSPDMEEGEYSIAGSKVFARVMSYPTKKRDSCKIEAHNLYVDIQATLTGGEGIDIFEREGLKVTEEYDADKDVIFFADDHLSPHCTTANYCGYFTMLFPEEAHRPQEEIEGINYVKKFVIKMEVSSFEK